MPFPAWLAGWTATAALVLALVGLSTRPTARPLVRRRSRSLSRVPSRLARVAAIAGLAGFAIVVTLGFTNGLLADRVALQAWAVLALLSALAGDVFRALSPWRTATRGLARARPNRPRPYPRRLARWPAAAGVFAFALTQVAAPPRWQSSITAAFLLAYAAVQVAGARRYGDPAWSERADGLGVSLSALSQVAPLTTIGGRLLVRHPLSGLEPRTWLAGTAALLAVTVAAANHATAGRHPTIRAWSDTLLPSLPYAIANVLGLALATAVALAIYGAALAGMRRAAPSRDAARLRLVLGPALVPIALAYLVAQQLVGGVWSAQLVVLTIGHLAGLAIAYDRSVATIRNPTVALRASYWVLGVLVASLTIGIWLTWQA